MTSERHFEITQDKIFSFHSLTTNYSFIAIYTIE